VLERFFDRSMDRFQTARIRAERLSPDHSAELCAMHCGPRVMATVGGVRSDEATRNFNGHNSRCRATHSPLEPLCRLRPFPTKAPV
jgi:hypothetical protein